MSYSVPYDFKWVSFGDVFTKSDFNDYSGWMNEEVQKERRDVKSPYQIPGFGQEVPAIFTAEDINKVVRDAGIPYMVTQSNMRHDWWVAYRWEVVTAHGDEEPIYVRAGLRPIGETLAASEEFHLARTSAQSASKS